MTTESPVEVVTADMIAVGIEVFREHHYGDNLRDTVEAIYTAMRHQYVRKLSMSNSGMSTPTSGRVIHVNGNVTLSGDGSEDRPFKTISEALSAAKGDPTASFLLAPGVYVCWAINT